MTSLTQQKKRIKKRKNRTCGKGRKQSLSAGTTPRFPIHLEDDPDCVTPMPPASHPDEKK